MNLIVVPDPKNPSRGVVTCGAKKFLCALGRSGVSTAKREGDGATPAGTFPIRRLLYRADRGHQPLTQIPALVIEHHDGWCDAPDDPNYNRPVRLPYAASAENLWRDDGVYDLIVVIGHNDAPVVAGLGGAIFMHIATPDVAPTAGCVALPHEDLLSVLSALDANSTITIQAR
ncbi:MAG: hypothetical protein EXR11_01860 [Rhodospirillaceae bacterium]|nr:hypothetical protein [Rhodospirillaceae bacterium]